MHSNEDTWPGQLFHQAAIYNNEELLHCILQGEERANINSQDVCGRTALYTAVSNGSLQCLKALLENGADMNIPAGSRCHNMTPLHASVLDNRLDALALLLANGADLTQRDESGKTALALAYDMKNMVAAAMIGREQEKTDKFLDRRSTELCEACAEGKLDDVKKVLHKSGPYRKHVINMATRGLSPLGIASRGGHSEILSFLLAEGASCTTQKDTGLTLLHLACEAGTIKVIELLLNIFPDLNYVRSVEHQLPLHSAVVFSKADVVKLLLEFPYPPSNCVTFTDTATCLLYEANLELNAQDAAGDTALHIACRNGHVEIVKLLLNHIIKVEVERDQIPKSSSIRSINSDTNNENLSGLEENDFGNSLSRPNSPTRRLRRNKKYIQSIYPVDVTILNNNGLSSYHLAIRHRHADVLKVLLESRGIPPDKMKVQDSENSVLMFAYEHSTAAVLELLLSHGLKDVDNKVLSSAFFSNDEEVKWLMLTYKSSRDMGRTINKTEMRRLAFQVLQLKDEKLDRISSLDSEYKSSLPSTSVAIGWDGLGMLNRMNSSCLIKTCFLHNPPLNLTLDKSIVLCAITKVDISKNSFEKFPVILFELPSLILLKAYRNQIAEIPEDCGISCFSLEELHLQENRISTLPKFIFHLPLLKYLDVSVNKLTEMPPDMWESPSLVTLNLSNNNISWLPHMSRDQLSAKQMPTRPSRVSLGSMKRGVSPSLSSSVSSYDDTIAGDGNRDMNDFTFLSSQDLTNNPVVRVNKWQSAVTVVDSNPWKGSGHQSSGLKQLWLNHNKFTQVPPCLACCAPNLEELVLSENPLSSIGMVADFPASLVELDLSKTGLTTMDPWKAPIDPFYEFVCFGPIGNLTQAKYSSMSTSSNSPSLHHRLKNGGGSSTSHGSPTSLTRESMFIPCPHRSNTILGKLEKLSLSHNRLSSLVVSRDSAKMGLRSFDTQSICSLESEEIQSRLLFPNISELNLGCNQLTFLPPDIGELSSLRILSLKGNCKLRELPPKLGLLKSLWKLDLELCPLDGAMQDILLNSRFPVKDILGFLQSVLEDSTEYNCMNLMLVGFHKIGKTSLLQKLCEKGKSQNPTHWRDRVNKQEGRKQATLLSTVGIDINQLVLEKRSKGPVTLRTWDFGGQREYYATHQYFLSPRSLYLVVWSIIDGERGVESLLQWLINIQARAPGASVIIVGTHLDILHDKTTKRNYPEDFEESMKLLIQKMFLSNPEPDKSGLPNILTAVNVSCKTGENITQLFDVIYDNVFELKHPRSKTQYLIKQKIPRKYLLLQEIVRELAIERLKDHKEPVLNRSKYTLCVLNKMMEHGATFRDVEELEQATRFLHENGVLFYYDDLPLRDLFFLDPQWLCDQLAKVITVKEINNFAQRGVMRVKNLEFLFKSDLFEAEQNEVYITNLLSKFEVALQFDEEHLLLPSLLPTETELLEMARKKSDVKIPLRKPNAPSVRLCPTTEVHLDTLRFLRLGNRVEGPPSVLHVGTSMFYTGLQDMQESTNLNSAKEANKLLLLTIKPTSNPIFSCCRLYFMTYFPSGFWPRLITRVLADDSLYPIVKELFPLPLDLLMRSPEVKSLSERDPEWRCWQTGFELFYLGFEVLKIREVSFSTSSYFCDYSQCRIRCSIDSEWSFLDVLNSKILEITFPTDSLKFHVTNKDGPQLKNLDLSKPSSTVYREEVATTKLLVKIVEHVDNLLQDWYPDLGELRFNQNCDGRYLVTRIIPCPQCLNREVIRQKVSKNTWYFLNPDVPEVSFPVTIPEMDMVFPNAARNGSENIATGGEERETAGRSRAFTDGQVFIYNQGSPDTETVIFSWLVERCMLDALEGVDAMCPRHGSVSPLYLLDREGITHQLFIAPDVIFQDCSKDLLLPSSHLDIGPCLGKGNFGEVYEGWAHKKDNCPPDHVAVKILFKHVHAKMEIKRGFQNFMELACRAYLTARQEVSILRQLEHPHIVPLIGLCLQPLCLILMLAPNGSLDAKLSDLHVHGEQLPLFVIRQIIIQVSKALSYLHSHNIIYRDLKSENVLVWELPTSAYADPRSGVEVKLADYGISREVLPTGTRGFGGTPPFIAPEILQHAGKGTYTTKVDIFSFGMFMFEIMTCRLPFANANHPNNLICQGERPSLTVQEAERCPTLLLDLMSLCWSQDPEDRPTMEGILGIARCPQFCHLQDVVTLGPNTTIYCGCTVTRTGYISNTTTTNAFLSDQAFIANSTNQLPQMSHLWLSASSEGNNSIDIFTVNSAKRVESSKSLGLSGPPIVAMCVYDDLVWCVDNQGLIQMFHCGSLSLIHQQLLPTPSNAHILSIHPDPCHRRVIIVSADGTVYTTDQPHLDLDRKDNSAIVYKGNKCYSSLMVHSKQRCELWLGQSKGSICVWNADKESKDYCLSHGSEIAKSSSSCAFLVTVSGASDCKFVWSYNYPGSVIFMWDTYKRCIVEKLDCSNIVSTVDSPVMATSEQFECGQVSALSAIDRYLYIGTTRGSVLITEAATLTPICVFQCHAAEEFYIKTILPITPMFEDYGTKDEEDDAKVEDDNDISHIRVPAVFTLGKGYSNILKTFHPTMDLGPNKNMLRSDQQLQVDPHASHTFLLSWNSVDWEYY